MGTERGEESYLSLFPLRLNLLCAPGPRVEGEAALRPQPPPQDPYRSRSAASGLPASGARAVSPRNDGSLTPGAPPYLPSYISSLAPLPYLLLICLILHSFYIHSLSDHVIRTNGLQVPCLLRTFSSPS